MTRYLLDVSVLIALMDPDHVHHDLVHLWFDSTGSKAWATCPITENGLLRILGSNRYPNTPGTPAAVARKLKLLRRQRGHQFWADDVSLLSDEDANADHLLDSKQVADVYLLALARSHGGFLATLDRKIATNAVQNGRDFLHVIG